MARQIFAIMVIACVGCKGEKGSPTTPETKKEEVVPVPQFPAAAEPARQSAVNFVTAPDSARTVSMYSAFMSTVENLYASNPAQARELSLMGPRKALESVTDQQVEAADIALGGNIFRSASTPPRIVENEVTCIYVNGIATSSDNAATSRKEIENFGSHCGTVYNFYNPSSAYAGSSGNRCLKRALQLLDPKSLLGCALSKDYPEAIRQVTDLLNILPRQAEPVARSLARSVLQERALGNPVILIGHSQGNLMIAQALREIGPYDACIGIIALGSPVGKSAFGSWRGSGNLTGFSVMGDILLSLGQNDFEKIATSVSRNAEEKIARYRQLAVAYGAVSENMKLHSMGESYMAAEESRNFLRTQIDGMGERFLTNPDCYISAGLRIYASDGRATARESTGPSNLWTVNPRAIGRDTLVARLRTSNGTEPIVSDVALSPSGELFATSLTALYLVNKSTAILELVGTYPGNREVNALAFDPQDRLYAAGPNGEYFELLVVEKRVGRECKFSYDSSGDIAFAPSGESYLVVTDGDHDRLARVDFAICRVTLLPQVIGFRDVWGLAFVGNILYGFTTDRGLGSGSLIRISTSTGQGTFVRNLAFDAFGAGVSAPY